MSSVTEMETSIMATSEPTMASIINTAHEVAEIVPERSSTSSDEGKMNKIKKLVEEKYKITSKVKRPELIDVVKALGINVNTDQIVKKTGKPKKKTKKILIKDIQTSTHPDKYKILLDHPHIFAMKIKDILKLEISFELLKKLDVLVKYDGFKQKTSKTKTGYFKDNIKIPLKLNAKGKVVAVDINKEVKDNLNRIAQGLYALCVDGHIVKLGSFAETQGIGGRIGSFGGGCNPTGSITNKWFQKFINKQIKYRCECYFMCWFPNQEKYTIKEYVGDTEETNVGYHMRPHEAKIFSLYESINNNIPPIFGSNCT